MPFFKSGDLQLFYVDKGSGNPIVFLHGALASHKIWREQLGVFSERYRVIAMDFKGHGDSDKPPRGYGQPTNVRDVKALVDHLKIKKAVIVGSSMGGGVAQYFCLEHPDRVMALVLVGARTRALWYGKEAEYEKRFLKVSVDELVREWFTAKSKEEDINFAIQEARRSSLDFLHNVVRDTGSHDITSRLREIQVPTLIVVGEGDAVTPVAASKTIQGGIKGSELHVFPGCGHLVMLEKPTEFNQQLKRFLQKIFK